VWLESRLRHENKVVRQLLSVIPEPDMPAQPEQRIAGPRSAAADKVTSALPPLATVK
jgi:hypothetical protein